MLDVSKIVLISTFSFTVTVDKFCLLIVNSAFDTGSINLIVPCFSCSANSVFPNILVLISSKSFISSLL